MPTNRLGWLAFSLIEDTPYFSELSSGQVGSMEWEAGGWRWRHGLVLRQGADVRRGLPSRTVAAPGPRYATQRLRIRNLVPLSGDRPSARRSGLVQAFREWSLR